MRILLTIIITGMFRLGFSQPIIIHNNPGLNSAQTENAWRWAETYEKEVREAFRSNDLNKANYSLSQWDKCRGCKNKSFWILKAEYCIKTGKNHAAKRYYMRAYESYNCYECKEKANAINSSNDNWHPDWEH